MVERWAGFAHSSFVKLLLLVTLLANQSYAEKATNDRYFTNGWAIKVPEPGGIQKAKEIAKRHGFQKVSKVRNSNVSPRIKMFACFYSGAQKSKEQHH